MPAQQQPSFVYKKRTADAVTQRANQKGGMYDSPIKNGVLTFTPQVGDNTIRFLPPTWENGEHYGYDVWIHNNIGGDRNQYACLEKMGKGKCPICDYRKQLEQDGASSEEISALKPSRRVAVWLIDRATEKEGPKLWLMSWTLDKEIATLSINKRSGAVLAIDHPDAGYDITFTREGQGLKTRYLGVRVERDTSSIAVRDDRYNHILDFIQENKLPDAIQFFPPEHIEAVLAGKGKGDDDDKPAGSGRSRLRDAAAEAEEPAPRRRAATVEEEPEPAPRRRAAAAEPDADEVLGGPTTTRRRVPADEEAEEQPAPRRRGRGDEPPDDDPEQGRRAAAMDPPARRRVPVDEPEEAPPPRRREAPVEEEEPPARRTSMQDPPPRRRAAAEEEEELAQPVRRRAAAPVEEEDPAPPPRRRAAPVEEEDPAPAPRRRAAPVEDEEPPPARRRAAPVEEEAEPSPRSRLNRLRDEG